MHGQFWVLEGADGVGKSTQVALLQKRLLTMGIQSQLLHFPHYDGIPWGTLIKEYLQGDVGGIEVDPHYAGILYAADRGEQKDFIKQTLEAGTWVLADRYASSNLAHQGVKIKDPTKRLAYQQWLEKVEFTHFQVVRPTGTILLSASSKLRTNQLHHRNQKLDIHEKDSAYLDAVAQEYTHLASTHKWPVVEVSGDEALLPPEEIAEKIWQIIQPN